MNTSMVALSGSSDVEILSVVETRAMDIHREVLELQHLQQETYFRLASLLYEVVQGRLYRSIDAGYVSFEAYCESIDISFRKARYLVDIWWWFGIKNQANPRLMEVAVDIGWTKARELIGVIDASNVTEWHPIAQEKSREELIGLARASLMAAGKSRRKVLVESDMVEDHPPSDMEPKDVVAPVVPVPPQSPVADPDLEPPSIGVAPPTEKQIETMREQQKETKWVRKFFDFTDDQWEVVAAALDLAERHAGSTHKGHLMATIATHFASYYASSASGLVGEWLKQIENVSGLQIVAIDRKTDTVVYGQGFIDEMQCGKKEE